MSVTPSPIGGFAAQFFDNNGVILSGGKIYTYAAGTTTPQASYTSALGITPHANPIILDSAGRVPGGEIWLTDGLIYKFVIETALAVLIGTYDNITGVNSNFVNYTIQEEVITATAGQTVFNLSTINYTPGTNSLSVYIDGVNQYVGDSYLETDSDTVTFTSGVHVGGEVKFTTAIQISTGAIDSSNVGFLQAGTGAVATTVQAKLREIEVSVFDYLTAAEITAVQAYTYVTNVTTNFQKAIDYAFKNALRLRVPAGGYLVSQLVYPSDISVEFRGYPFHIYGDGRGEVFVTPSLQRGTVIRGNSATLSTFRFRQGAVNQGSGNLHINDIRFEGTQNANIPVVEFDTLYSGSRFEDCDVYQYGVGHGVVVKMSNTSSIQNCHIINYDWNTSVSTTRTGIGLYIYETLSTGLTFVEKVTSRGFDTAYKFGDASANRLYSLRVQHCECSVVKNGMWLTSSVQGAVVENCYIEGGDLGTAVLDEGSYNKILNNLIFSGFLVGIDATDTTTYGGTYSGNIIAAGSVPNTKCLKISSSGGYGGPGKIATGNTIVFNGSGGSIAGVVGIQIAGTDPRLDLSGNVFDPRGPWVGGAGTTKINDLSTSSFSSPSSLSRGLYGLQVVANGNQEFPLLAQGMLSFGRPENALTNAAVVSTVLTTGDGSFFVLTMASAANIGYFAGGGVEGRYVKIYATNANPTFVNSANMKLAGSANYTPPATGAILTFFVSGSTGGYPIAYECAGRVVF